MKSTINSKSFITNNNVFNLTSINSDGAPAAKKRKKVAMNSGETPEENNNNTIDKSVQDEIAKRSKTIDSDTSKGGKSKTVGGNNGVISDTVKLDSKLNVNGTGEIRAVSEIMDDGRVKETNQINNVIKTACEISDISAIGDRGGISLNSNITIKTTNSVNKNKGVRADGTKCDAMKSNGTITDLKRTDVQTKITGAINGKINPIKQRQNNTCASTLQFVTGKTTTINRNNESDDGGKKILNVNVKPRPYLNKNKIKDNTESEGPPSKSGNNEKAERDILEHFGKYNDTKSIMGNFQKWNKNDSVMLVNGFNTSSPEIFHPEVSKTKQIELGFREKSNSTVESTGNSNNNLTNNRLKINKTVKCTMDDISNLEKYHKMGLSITPHKTENNNKKHTIVSIDQILSKVETNASNKSDLKRKIVDEYEFTDDELGPNENDSKIGPNKEKYGLFNGTLKRVDRRTLRIGDATVGGKNENETKTDESAKIKFDCSNSSVQKFESKSDFGFALQKCEINSDSNKKDDGIIDKINHVQSIGVNVSNQIVKTSKQKTQSLQKFRKIFHLKNNMSNTTSNGNILSKLDMICDKLSKTSSENNNQAVNAQTKTTVDHIEDKKVGNDVSNIGRSILIDTKEEKVSDVQLSIRGFIDSKENNTSLTRSEESIGQTRSNKMSENDEKTQELNKEIEVKIEPDSDMKDLDMKEIARKSPIPEQDAKTITEDVPNNSAQVKQEDHLNEDTCPIKEESQENADDIKKEIAEHGDTKQIETEAIVKTDMVNIYIFISTS